MSLPTSSRTWRPLWEEGPPPEAERVLRGIAEALTPVQTRPDLAGGSAGTALLHAYLELGRPGRGHGRIAEAHLEAAIEGIGSEVTPPTYYAGFTGVAWALDHLRNRLPIAADGEANEGVDEALLDFLDVRPWRLDYDLISGLVGYGVYAMERLDRPAGAALAERVLSHLEQLQVPAGPGVTWVTPPERLPPWQRERCPAGYHNLGLAHGMPGVLALMGHFHARGFEASRCSLLAEAGVRWLLAQRKPEGFGSAFPAWIPLDDASSEGPTRLSWCYGDLGVSLALLVAARGLGRADWEREALDIARAAAMRRPPEGAHDACLCHGFAGNAHLFNRLWQATGEEVFAQAARHWMLWVLMACRPDRGVAGFQAWMPPLEGDRDPWRDERGLLEGVAGIGLVLAAALDPVAPEWDRMLLVDVPDPKAMPIRR